MLFLLAFRAIWFRYEIVMVCANCPHVCATGLNANGTAVEGVCVTGAASRVSVPFVSSETVPVARQYGAIFAITVREGFVTIAVQAGSF